MHVRCMMDNMHSSDMHVACMQLSPHACNMHGKHIYILDTEIIVYYVHVHENFWPRTSLMYTASNGPQHCNRFPSNSVSVCYNNDFHSNLEYNQQLINVLSVGMVLLQY